MAETSEFESDQFLKLLTDALRAGPGSPQWHEAVERLRAVNPAEADEYRLLVSAREHLESGRDYRSISAGPGFTRKVMDAIDREASGRKLPLPSANIIALVAGAAILVVMVILAINYSGGRGEQDRLEDLRKLFNTTVVYSEFGQSMPVEWKKFGLEPVLNGGLRGGVEKDGKDYKRGGVVAVGPLAAEQPVAIQAAVRAVRPSGQVRLQIFLSEDPNAASEREFAADLWEGQLSVWKPGGKTVGDLLKLDEQQERVYVLIKMSREYVIVEVDGKQLYAGPHGLAPDRARYPGVRFLTKGSDRAAEDVTVQSIRILKP